MTYVHIFCTTLFSNNNIKIVIKSSTFLIHPLMLTIFFKNINIVSRSKSLQFNLLFISLMKLLRIVMRKMLALDYSVTLEKHLTVAFIGYSWKSLLNLELNTENYLRNWQQFVNVDNENSDMRFISNGVPQGSIPFHIST